MKTSFCTRVSARDRIAIFGDQGHAAEPFFRAPVCFAMSGRSTIEGTCMREPAFTKRTSIESARQRPLREYASKRERAGLLLVERNAVDQVIQRRIVHHRRITGHVSRGGRISAASRLARPHRCLAEAGRVDRGADGIVLHRVDLTQHQRNIRIVADPRISRARAVFVVCGRCYRQRW